MESEFAKSLTSDGFPTICSLSSQSPFAGQEAVSAIWVRWYEPYPAIHYPMQQVLNEIIPDEDFTAV